MIGLLEFAIDFPDMYGFLILHCLNGYFTSQTFVYVVLSEIISELLWWRHFRKGGNVGTPVVLVFEIFLGGLK